ncbi:MAG: NAD-glutamate dehydrogenase [Sinobacteraceae bacterium]|nr:NAD-glutamate dehydrogenase [Nevskiaceae bacterium]
MPQNLPRRRLTQIAAIVTAARRAAPKDRLRHISSRDFLEAYFRGVDEDDLAAHAPRDLALAAFAHLRRGTRRRRGETRLEIFNPTLAQHGFDSTSTFVAIVTDDMPFLVDSLGMAFSARGIAIHLLVHPVLEVQRDAAGRLRELRPGTGEAVPATAGRSRRTAMARHESWQLYEIDRQYDPEAIRALQHRLQQTLADVRAAVEDWRPMRQRMRALADDLKARTPARTPREEATEASHLLDWMESGHFVFLGYRQYRLRRGRTTDRLEPHHGTGLGILRDGPGTARATTTLLRGRMREVARSPAPLVISKANSLATVHRAAYLDYVAVKEFDAHGTPRAEHRFIGLWTSTAYFASPQDIPLLRRKVDTVIAQFGLDPSSHDGKAAMAVLENWPRDELFQSTVRELVAFVRSVVNLYERRTTRLLARRDPFGRFWSCMAYVPRDRYTTEVRQRIELILRQALDGADIESQVQISSSKHARVHVVVRTSSGAAAPARFDVDAVERQIALAATTWTDRLRAALVARFEASAAARLATRYGTAFPLAYQDEVDPADALDDVADLESLHESPQALRLNLHRPPGSPPSRLHLRIVKAGGPIAISDLLPMMENFGLRVMSERPWRIALPDVAGGANVQDFELEHGAGLALDIEKIEPRFVEAVLASWRGEVENDGFHRLLLPTSLTVRQLVVLRAYCRYLLQTGLPFSQVYMERVLTAHTAFAADLVRLFETRFDPDAPERGRDGRTRKLSAMLTRRLESVAGADEDRILRAFLATIEATLRTNFWQRDAHGAMRPTLALKLDPAGIPGLPLPRPRFEIFVYSPSVEGVHLRMGLVARGGLRWSDRREDFRTEILGLMKAQNVKNTLIVPVGAKGGFVPRRLAAGASRDEAQRQGVAAYRDFIGALLDVTDNIVGERIVPPPRTVRQDGDDPYLVVAADKGTASFSDTANGIALERGFWLGDAFASGGSAGYDHKKMGITARGAWECVKRHFRELGLDTQATPFTVAGIGDMSGDVFGNGMLLSPQIKLVAAFNHQHIFIDPDPDPRRSWRERERLFRLPRSGWDDYDRRLLSRGGGVHLRSAKTIPLSPEAQRLLGIAATTAPPIEVIRAILRMQVDLLWNGGIGTYVKASTESPAAAGDRSNDAVRVDGRELRARVVGEGGNLGFTQLGRVEYALTGGRINTDFIDNSAGVNTSDVEVNLKILTNAEERRSALQRPERNRLLFAATDEVALLVLRNNYLQSQALSTLEAQAARRLLELQHVTRLLEREGLLDRKVEFLPDDETFAERHKRSLGLTRPELAVLLSYSKISLNQQLIESDVPEDPYLSQELERYFPARFARRFPRAITRHRLRREIIATATTNSVINRMGPSFVPRAIEDTGANAAQVARAYSTVRECFDLRACWARIEALDNRVPAAIQYAMHGQTARLLRHTSYWLLHHRRGRLDIEATVRHFRPAIRELSSLLPGALAGLDREAWQRNHTAYADHGAPPELASFMASSDAMATAFDIVEIATARRAGLALTAGIYFHAGARLGLDWLRAGIESLPVDGTWQAVARRGLRDAALRIQRRIAEQVLAVPGRSTVETQLERWLVRRATDLEPWRRTLADLQTAGGTDFATLSVGVEALRKLLA